MSEDIIPDGYDEAQEMYVPDHPETQYVCQYCDNSVMSMTAGLLCTVFGSDCPYSYYPPGV